MRTDFIDYSCGFDFIAGAGYAGTKIPRWRWAKVDIQCRQISRLAGRWLSIFK